jgi:gas vesicle protein
MYVKPSGVLFGIVGAFALGALTGVLWAPTAGVRTRRRLIAKGREVGERAADAVESAGDLVDRAKRRIA